MKINVKCNPQRPVTEKMYVSLMMEISGDRETLAGIEHEFQKLPHRLREKGAGLKYTVMKQSVSGNFCVSSREKSGYFPHL